MAPPLEEGRRRRSRVVGAGEDGFLIGLSDPDELLLLGAGRDPVRRIPLPGEPTALAAAGGRVAVGTRAPDVLVMLGPGGERSEHRVPGDTSSGPEASTGISSIALTEREAWVTTEEADGRTVVHLLDLGSRQWVALPYAEARRGFNLPRIHLRAGASDVVWGVTKGTRPSSLYRLDRKGVEQFGGHQVAAVACTGDVAPAADGTIFVTSCDGSLLRGRPRLDGFATVADIDSRFFPLVKGDWRMQWIAGGEDTLAVAVTVLAVDSTRHKPVPLVSRIGWSIPGVDRALVGFERDSLTVASLAVRDTMALAAVTSARGVRDLVAVPLRRR